MPLLIAGTHSGCGKSTVALGIMAALRRLGRPGRPERHGLPGRPMWIVQPFKAGPDFIDAGLHAVAAGRASRNLDLYMCGADYVRDCISRHSAGAESVVIEGVMGLYDGGERSTSALAKAVGAKVLLVVDAYGMAESAAAVVKGFKEYGGAIDGVVFNRVGSERHFDRLKAAIDSVEVLGYLPRDADFAIPERHLGLVTAEESPVDKDSLERLAAAASTHINMNRLMEMSKPHCSDLRVVRFPEPDVRIAVARDKAFCFYYEDNLDMLREAGAEIVPFSPLDDAALPEGVSAIYIGGGYPEVHAKALSENSAMTSAIKDWVEGGRPLYAECGGLMYLGEGIAVGGAYYPMAGVFPFKCVMKEKAASLGYREISVGEDCILGKKGQALRGHEFHYSEIDAVSEKKGVRLNIFSEKEERVVSAMYKSALASYVHVHFGSRLGAAGDFINYIIKEAKWKR